MIDPRSVPSTFGEYTVIVQGVPLESAPLIENVLPGEDDDIVEALYKSEKLREHFAANGVTVMDYGGGVIGIPITMMVTVPVSLLRNIKLENKKAIGLRRAKKIVALFKEKLAEEPYY